PVRLWSLRRSVVPHDLVTIQHDVAITILAVRQHKGSHEHERFTFLGYTFRPRLAKSRSGEFFVSFCPAVADDAVKEIGRTIKCWRLHLWSRYTLADLAQAINPTVRGWINYYGRFYRSKLISLLRRIDEHLVR